MNGRNLCVTPQVDKVARFFGRRQTYHVARVQRINTKEEPVQSWVTVHNLKSFSGGGILDPDDKLKDVADDREQLFAAYEEQGVPYSLVPNSDGISTTSSLGTDSPDIFPRTESQCSSRNDVEVNCDTIASGFAPLHVRRGSEPALNRISPIPILNPDPMKRWSAAVFGDEDLGPDVLTKDAEKLYEEEESVDEKRKTNGDHLAFQRFSSESGRLSILGNNAETFRWVEAADRQLFKYQSQESLGNEKTKAKEKSNKITNLVTLRNEGGPLGIHVVPDYDETGKDMGLVVQGIEPGGRIDRDGRLQVQDRIVEINGQCLLDVSFQKAQEIFKDALQTTEIKLRVLKDENDDRVGPKTITTTPTKKSVVSTATSRPTSMMLSANTRKIGKKIHIQLTKGNEGLGFSVTTRDNPAGGNCPIYIKNILPKGAAIQDGRLKPGDRLLEVNAIEMTGKSQSEAVTILRNTPLGGVVKLVVSRQEVESPKLPREMPESSSRHDNNLINGADGVKQNEEGSVYPWKHRETLTLIIPLNDTESAGLGVSVKGKTSTGPKGTSDLGIFVKSVITGGAASKDGRLQENDQLLSVNDISLLGMSNSSAMDTLRRAIQQEGPNPFAITLLVARRVNSSGKVDLNLGQDGSVSSDNCSANLDTISATSEHSDGTTVTILQPWSVRRDSDENRNLDQREGAPRKIEDKDLGLDVPLRNPVVERLTGQRNTNPTRNESYYRATHELTPSPQAHTRITINEHKPVPLKRTGSMASPTVNLINDNSVMVQDDYPSPEQVDSNLTDRGQNVVDGDAAYTSQLSLDEVTKNFSRDGFGRQSMSEKRHAHLDAKNTDTYQRNKKAREEKEKLQQNEFRANSADSLLNVTRSKDSSGKPVKPSLGPVLGMKKSSSLESLQTLVAESAHKDEDGENFARPSVKSLKGRGCNESFRAAVDRSYEAPHGSLAEGMETLDEESEYGGTGFGRGSSWQSKTPGEFAPDEIFQYGKKGVKKKSLLKGLGSVFKFGKQRKNIDQLPRLTMQDLEEQKLQADKIHARKAAQEEQERIQEHYRKLLQRQSESYQQPTYQHQHTHQHQHQHRHNGPIEHEEQNRQQRIQQLRTQHQRKHQERQGHYPGDHQQQYSNSSIDRQDPIRNSFQVLYSSISPIHRRTHSHIHPQRYESEVVHSRSHSYDVFKEIDRPGSRKGYADPNKFSHYVNYEEIQHHLNQQKKPFFLNQRENLGPKTTYTECDSIEGSFKRLNPSEMANSLPRKSHQSKLIAPAQIRSSVKMNPPPPPPPGAYSMAPRERRERSPGKSQVIKDEIRSNSALTYRQPGQFKYAVGRHRDSANAGSKV